MVKTSSKRKRPVDGVTRTNAYKILQELTNRNARLSRRAEELAHKYTAKRKSVNPDLVAKHVFDDLDCLDVDDLYKESGRTGYGYVDPNEHSWEMFDEAMKPYVEKMRKYQESSMREEAKLQCMGILRGLYKFENESTTEFTDWIEDTPGEKFDEVFNEWKKWNKNPKDLEEMKEFVREYQTK